jgi:hypothetical protein
MSNLSAANLRTTPIEIRVGTIINKSFVILGHQFQKFLLLSLLPMAPLLLLILMMAGGPKAPGVGLALAGALTAILTVVLQTVAQATSLYGAFQDMRGQPFTIGQSLEVVLARAVPVVGVALLAGLAIGLGTLLFIVPGVIIGCMLFVAIPACVIEKSGVIDSLKRSAALTQGYRWQVFGLFLLVVVMALVGEFVLTGIGGEGMVGQILSFAWQVVLTAFSAVLCAVIYHDLRAVKEGIHLDTQANVFG